MCRMELLKAERGRLIERETRCVEQETRMEAKFDEIREKQSKIDVKGVEELFASFQEVALVTTNKRYVSGLTCS